MKQIKLLGVLLAGASAVAAPLSAQTPLAPRSLGMAGAYTAVARGNDAVFVNPANLGLPGGPQWSVALPQLGIGASMLGPTFEDLPDLQNYDDLDEARRNEILASIPESGTDVRLDMRAPLVAFQNGNFGMGLAYGVVGGHTVGKDLMELMFNGYEDGRTDYNVGNTVGTRASFWDVAASYGRRVGPVSLGVTAHYIRGGKVLRSRLFEPRIDLDRRDIEVDYRAVYAKGGQGYGVDFGAAFQPVPSVTISAAVSNAWSQMKWSEELYSRELVLSRHDFDQQDAMGLYDRYEGSEQPIDASSADLNTLETAQGLYDEAYFPTIARFGAAWRSSFGTDLSVGFQDQLTTGRLGEGWDRVVSGGIQQKLPLGTVRGGYATNMDGGSMVSGGLSLGVLHLGAGKVNHGGSEGALRSGWIGTFGIGVAMQ